MTWAAATWAVIPTRTRIGVRCGHGALLAPDVGPPGVEVASGELEAELAGRASRHDQGADPPDELAARHEHVGGVGRRQPAAPGVAVDGVRDDHHSPVDPAGR